MKRNPAVKGYNLSTDYNLLYKLVKQGYIIVGWLCSEYNHDWKHNIRILCDDYTLFIGFYDDYDSFSVNLDSGKVFPEFLKFCKDKEIQFILPEVR